MALDATRKVLDDVTKLSLAPQLTEEIRKARAEVEALEAFAAWLSQRTIDLDLGPGHSEYVATMRQVQAEFRRGLGA